MATKEQYQRILQKKRVQAEIAKRQQGRQPTDFGSAMDTGFGVGFGSTVGGAQQINAKIANLLRSDKSMGPRQPTTGDVLADILSRDEGALEKESQERASKYRAAEEKSKVGAILGNLLGSAVSTAPAAAIPGVGIAANPWARVGLNAARGAGEGALASGVQYVPEGQSRAENILGGATLGGSLGGLMRGAGEAYQALRPTNLLRGDISKEDLARNLMAARGTETNLGQILQNPRLAGFYENYLMKLPFSGATAAAQRSAEKVRGRGEGILSELSGGEMPKEEIGLTLQKGLQDVVSQAEALKRENYAVVNAVADQLGIQIEPKHFQKAALDINKKFQKNSRLASKIPESQKREIWNYAKGNAPESLEEANIFKGILGEEAADFRYQGKKYLGGIYSRLANAAKEDIAEGIDNSGYKALKDVYKDAEHYYKMQIAPLEDPAITRFSRQGGDPDTIIKSFLKPERPILLEKLTDVFSKSDNSEELMNALRSGVFSNAIDKEGKLNPNKMMTIFNKLSEKQKKLLLEGNLDQMKYLQDFDRLVGMNQKGLYSMANPLTGNTIADFFAAKSLLTGGGLPLRPVASALSSEKFRENLVGKMLEEKAIDKNKLSAALKRNFPRAVAGVSAQNREEKK